MPAPYSYDLRQKAIEAFKSGERKSDVCRMFDISHNTLDLWLKREAQTGDYQAMTHFQRGYQHKITDWKRFEEFVQKHGVLPQLALQQVAVTPLVDNHYEGSHLPTPGNRFSVSSAGWSAQEQTAPISSRSWRSRSRSGLAVVNSVSP